MTGIDSFWANLKENIVEGLNVAAKKTEEYTKIGRLKIEISSLKTKIQKIKTNIGEKVYSNIYKSEKTYDDIKADLDFLYVEIDKLLGEIEAKNQKIEDIKEESRKDVEDIKAKKHEEKEHCCNCSEEEPIEPEEELK